MVLSLVRRLLVGSLSPRRRTDHVQYDNSTPSRTPVPRLASELEGVTLGIDKVRQVGGAAAGPVGDVVGLTFLGGFGAAGDDAAAVAGAECSALCR